jgi:hypothetical protein
MIFDHDGFKELMNLQKDLAKKSWKGKINYQKENHEFLDALKKEYGETKFDGYDEEFCFGQLIGLISDLNNEKKKTLIFNKTVLYSESGGQVSDSGFLSFDQNGEKFAEVFDLRKQSGFVFHECNFLDDLKLSKFNQILDSKKNLMKKFESDDLEGFEFFMLADDSKKQDSVPLFKIEFNFEKRENIKKKSYSGSSSSGFFEENSWVSNFSERLKCDLFKTSL